jgi:hypothetical protein
MRRNNTTMHSVMMVVVIQKPTSLGCMTAPVMDEQQ